MFESIKGQTIVITGASDGIGKAAAFPLAAAGASLILIGRNAEKTLAVADQIRSATPGAQVELVIADLSEMKQIRRAADEIKSKHAYLDALFNNAGASLLWRQMTPEGLEKVFALNHLGYMFLAQELLPLLKAAPKARIVNTSSAANYSGRIRLDDLQSAKRYSMMGAYSQTKLANILFTKKLARDLDRSTITVNCFHPGLVRTNFARPGNTIFANLFQPIVMRLIGAISEEEGADTGLYLLASPEVAEISGEYFRKRKVTRPNPEANDVDLQEKLWVASERLIRKALA
jgi:NAD(P)-dependent dehydrogenase (short-subunit alcohol dehydrogenase family)